MRITTFIIFSIALLYYLVRYTIKFFRYLNKIAGNKEDQEPDGELQLDIPDEEIQSVFPGGEKEIAKEVKKLQRLLPKAHPEELVKFVLVGSTVFYKQSGDKSERTITAYIQQISDSLISPGEAKIIYDFIYTRVLRALFGPIVGESHIDLLKGIVQFKGRDEVEEEDRREENKEDNEAEEAMPLDVPDEVMAYIFPGGVAEINKETTKLYARLQKAYPKNLVRSVLVRGAAFFSQSDDKSKGKTIAYLQKIAPANITAEDAKIIHDFIYTRALRIAMGKACDEAYFNKYINDIDELTGCDEDEIPGGKGSFGLAITNPIPVKGIISNEYYLERLRTGKGERITWERMGSRVAPDTGRPVDIYIIKNLEEAEIARFYISPYHKRVSNKAPAGFKLLTKSDFDPPFTSQTEAPSAEPSAPDPEERHLEPASIIIKTTDADGNEEIEVADPRLLTAATSLMAASAALLLPDLTKAAQHLQEAIADLDSFPGPDDAKTLLLLLRASQVSEQLGEADTAERLLERALKAQQNRKKTDQEILSDTQYQLGNLLSNKRDFSRAESLFRQSLQIRQNLFGLEHEKTAKVMLALAVVLQHGPTTAEAENLFRQALPLFRKIYGEEHSETALVLDNLARTLLKHQKTEEALPLAEKAYAIHKKEDITSEPVKAQCMSTLAIIYKRQGKLTEAENLQRQLLAILEEAYGTDNREFSAELGNLAGTLMEKGEEEEARELFYRALYIKEEYLPAEHPSIAHTLINLAGLHAQKGEFSKAESLAKRAYQIRAKALGDLHPETRQSFQLLQQIRADKNLVKGK